MSKLPYENFSLLSFDSSYKYVFLSNELQFQNLWVLEFKELDHGLGEAGGRTLVDDKKLPAGNRGWLEDYSIIEVTDSIRAVPKANFGVIYIVNAKDTVDINIDIEWVYPEKLVNEKGEKFKSIRYTTRRPTNIPSGSSYNLDEPYELLKGKWTMNIYVEKKKMYSKTFFLY